MACTLHDNNVYLGGAIDNEAVLSMGQGGAVYNHLGSSATLQNATLSANAATAGASGGAFEQEIVNLDTTQLHNTIVGAGGSTASGARDVSGSVTSNGYNLFQNAGLTVTGTTTGNIYFQDSKLGLWSDAQGYQDLLAGSPCIDAADPRAAQNPDVDQRGVARPSGAGYDVGAVETRAVFVFTNANDSGAGSCAPPLRPTTPAATASSPSPSSARGSTPSPCKAG